jgi:hypothetical protein
MTQNIPLSKPRQWPAFLAITKYATLAAVRNPATLAFGFIFPLVFITVFGLLGNGSSALKVGLVGEVDKNPISETLRQVKALDIRTGSLEEMNALMRKGELAAVIDVAKGSGAGSEVLRASQQYAVRIWTSSANPVGYQRCHRLFKGWWIRQTCRWLGYSNRQ